MASECGPRTMWILVALLLVKRADRDAAVHRGGARGRLVLVSRSNPEGVGVKSTKGRRSRLVPLADRALDIVADLSQGKSSVDLLCTTDQGTTLHRSAVVRSLDWENTAGGGRRIHDLRHTAACLWLARGVDPGTVQAWLGHESIATTNRYLHFLGTEAHRAGLERLNRPRGNGGAMETQKADNP